MEALSVEFGSGERSDHLAGIGFFDIEEGVAWQKVDAAHVDALAVDESVEHFDEVSGEEAVALAYVDIDSLEAAFGCSAVFLAVVFGAFVLTLGGSLAGLALRARGLGVDEVDFRCVFVVVEQAVEFERDDALEQVFLGEPFEFARDA
ncbi:hypothetical protein IMSAGC021_01459 [Muribaculaceae bacterium]|nr:hypothetical protein IMSAGC021_01459 [Muribaculaceae bacterium]